MVNAIAGSVETHLSIHHIPGANGANGLNAVYAAPPGDGVLATSLSAFVTAEAMGFGESSRHSWVAWLCAFAPAVVTVAADSPFESMEDLTAALQTNSLVGANSGFGTMSFVAAELFREEFDFENISHDGASPAINALRGGEADFAIMLSTEIALSSGELRALDTLPIGEYFGLFVPADTQNIDGIEAMLQTAAASDAFMEFARNAGLTALSPERNPDYINAFCAKVCQTLYDAGFLPVVP
jgi:tripartite-type tricarboxylate transporter receptor subunit TctC